MSIIPPEIDLKLLFPLLSVTLTAIVVLMAGLFIKRPAGQILAGVSLLGIVVAVFFTVRLWGYNQYGFGGMIVVDNLFVFFATVSLIIAGLSIALSTSQLGNPIRDPSEFYALLLFCTAGMLVLCASSDLLMLIIGIEILSIGLYVLTAFARPRLSSEEAAMKYFLLGAFSLGFLVYGAGLIFGATRSTLFQGIATGIGLAPSEPGVSTQALLVTGLGLLLVGIAFKLSLVPFHMWTPDVYEGAPTSVTAFMSVGTKAAVFIALWRLLNEAMPGLRDEWGLILSLIAILTMIVGNFSALLQTNLKRMLAYSSIAQAGYILVAVVASSRAEIDGVQFSLEGVMYYVMAYAFMNLGAFAVIIAVAKDDQHVGFEDLKGLWHRSPALALAMLVFMLSLAGIPPTAGFLAKLYVFSAAIQAGFLELAIVGVLTSVVAAYYYLRVILAMYSQPATEHVSRRVSIPVGVVIAIAVVATIQLGLFPVIPTSYASFIGMAGP